ncbi:hypothetical protein HAX54_039737 [Datura stramonium]|uniref:Uncharacterized protein n=1 Tax=Datura stramonium TaxID=4076 RepID=A0ABS8VNI3_DATST|nr:hypothetical protein [Datura stramonium]
MERNGGRQYGVVVLLELEKEVEETVVATRENAKNRSARMVFGSVRCEKSGKWREIRRLCQSSLRLEIERGRV